MKSLAILGAGPKAVAISAKLAVLKKLGFDTPEVEIFDPRGVAANWRPIGGWTDGRQLLGTSPHKDVGFPYRTQIAGSLNSEVDHCLLNLGWVRFLTDTNRYARWVDRGQPHPPHSMWAEYLQWVVQQTDTSVRELEITHIDIDQTSASEGQWRITAEDARRERQIFTSDSLLLTGPGRSDSRISLLQGVYSVADFWKRIQLGTFPHAARVVVVGGGESAASILDQLIRHDIDGVTVVSPSATMFSRGESQFENELYTNPRKWTQLSEAARKDFINRTDRGVLSVRVQTNLLLDDRIAHRRGYVTDVSKDRELSSSDLQVRITDEIAGDSTISCDVVIDARGGNSLWFRDLLSERAKAAITGCIGTSITGGEAGEAIERAIGYDLSVESLNPQLFIPALSAMRQGPGFANLSCLGELSDRVIDGLGVMHPSVKKGLIEVDV